MVSIILICHNYGRFLEDALKSVSVQSHHDWECIIIDSNSADNTEQIARHFVSADKRFSYHKREAKGPSYARNEGLRLAKGSWIQFLDGDDTMQKEKLASQLIVFNSYPDTDIAYGNVGFFDDGNPGNLRSSLQGDKSDDWMPRLAASGKEVKTLLRKYNFIIIHSPLLRRTVIDRIGYFDVNIPALEDWDFWQRCALGNCVFRYSSSVNDLALVRVHKNSLSRNSELMLKGNSIILQKRIREPGWGNYARAFFFLKVVELYWNSLFSGIKPVGLSLWFIILSVLFFPLYVILKVIRLIKGK